MVWAFIEKRRRIPRLGNDGDVGAGEKKGTKTKAEVVGQHQERFVVDRIVRAGSARPSSMKASHKKCRPHLKEGKDAEEEVFYNFFLCSAYCG